VKTEDETYGDQFRRFLRLSFQAKEDIDIEIPKGCAMLLNENGITLTFFFVFYFFFFELQKPLTVTLT